MVQTEIMKGMIISCNKKQLGNNKLFFIAQLLDISKM